MTALNGDSRKSASGSTKDVSAYPIHEVSIEKSHAISHHAPEKKAPQKANSRAMASGVTRLAGMSMANSNSMNNRTKNG
jgi:ribosomal protein S3AE